MKLRIQWVLLAMGAILAQGQAIAGSGPDSSDPTNPFSFNVFTIGNDTQSNVDDQGRVAVGGNLSSTGLSVGTSLSGSKTNNLIVGGNYSNQNNTVNGNVFIGGKATVSDPTVNGNFSAGSVDFSGYGRINGNLTYASCYTNPNTTVTGRISKESIALPINFSTDANILDTTSQTYSNLAATSSATDNYGSLTLTGTTGSPIDVFDLTASQLAGANSLTINAAPNATVLINVSGKSASLSNFGITLNGTNDQHVLYNFFQATSLDLSGISVDGTILAPKASTDFSNGNINGSLLTCTLTGGGEGHNFLFDGAVPAATPETSTMVEFLLLAGAGCVFLRRRRNAPEPAVLTAA